MTCDVHFKLFFFVFCFNYNKYSHTIQHPSDLARRKRKTQEKKKTKKTTFSAADMPSRLEGRGPAFKRKKRKEKKTKSDGMAQGGEGRGKAFTFSVAGKQKRWGPGRRDWCP